MNIQQAKAIPLATLLDRLGCEPHARRGDDVWYCSPFRDEQKPSFKFNQNKNIWFDFGEWKGGDAIELVKQLFQLGDVSASLAKLDELIGSDRPVLRPRPPPSSKPQVSTSSWLKLTDAGSIKSRALRSYLSQRGITSDVANRYLREVHYLRGDTPAIALGLENQSGGFEIRDTKDKRSLGAKDITVLGGPPQRVWLFEGMFDFLTAASQFGGKLDGTVIVLHGVGMKEKAVEQIRKLRPSVIELYRDNDEAGEKLLSHLQSELPQPTIVDWASLYAGYNDLNQWHVETRSLRHARDR